MPIRVLMPALSPTMTEGNLVKWHKKEGDFVKSGELLAEIETDKATMEVEAVDEGTLAKIMVLEGSESVPINQLIALLLEEGEEASALAKTMEDASAVASTSAPSPSEAPSAPTQAATPAPSSSKEETRLFATPLARRLASQNNVALESIEGSGPHGRIVKADIERAAKEPSPAFHPAALPSSSPSGFTDLKLSNMRKTIAQRLTESKQTIPHFYLSIDCEIDTLLDLRQQLNNRPQATQKLSVNDFVVRACALALKAVPETNVTWQGTVLRQYHNVDMAVAVAIDGGLVTPIVRSAEMKSLTVLAAEVKSLIERARAGKLKPEDYQGGSFTLSNLGMYGIRDFAAIINPPQASILAVGAGQARPIVKNNALTMATMMSCTLAVDHRAVDGALGSQWLKVFKELIENPLELLI